MKPSEIEPRQWASQAFRTAVAVVEVDVISGYSGFWQSGEQVQVRRLLAGSAPPRFEVYREREPTGPACDQELFAAIAIC